MMKRQPPANLFVLSLFGAVALPALSCRAQAPAAATVAEDRSLARFDAPLLFTYGTWDKKARTENGRLIVKGPGVTAKGGGGANVQINGADRANDCPTIRVRVGADNQMGVLRLLLNDAQGRSGTWEFALPIKPGASGVVVTLMPKDGAPLSRPNGTDKPGAPPLDLSRVAQWQFTGDYSDALVDIEVEALTIAAPTPAVLALRAERVTRDAAEQAKVTQARAEQRAKYAKKGPASPRLVYTSQVAPDILCLTIEAGRVVKGGLEPYAPQTGDTRRESKDNDGTVTSVVLVRASGEEAGWLIGPGRKTLVRFEKLEGDPLLDFVADDAATYRVSSSDDAAFATATAPVAVYRKSKPTDWAQPGRGFAMRHQVYLKMRRPLTPGKTYTLNVGELNVNAPASAATYRCNPARTESEAVHVSQVGYRADDPVKTAFLSVWLGTGGAHTLTSPLPAFSVRDAKTGKIALSGKVTLARAVTEPEKMFRSENFNKTSVYRMDFSALRAPGQYRVVVDGVGCSVPFTVGPNVWKSAFLTQMRGLFNNRSGAALGPPYTNFVKPRDFHPVDVKNGAPPIVETTYSALDKGGENFEEIKKGATSKPVPGAWGGYHDAGDWNPRRATHLKVTVAQLELVEMFPAFFRALDLNIPKTSVKAPDIINEALFEISLFRRLQKPDGGIPYGIETAGDPRDGEVSWLNSMPAYVLAPDLWSSYLYAQAALQVSKLLAPTDKTEAAAYRESALRALAWAEVDWRKRTANNAPKSAVRWEARDARNLAALRAYEVTGDTKWRDAFLEDTCLDDPNPTVFAWGDHVQRDAAFLYARLPKDKTDPALRATAIRLTLAEADKALDYATGNAWSLTTADRGQPLFLGFYSTASGGVELARAHFLSGNVRYLAGTVQACGFSTGANPNNTTYTVGLGQNYPRNPLHLDSRRTGQPAPTGITVYGNFDFIGWRDMQWANWPLTYHLGTVCTPSAWEWPIPEAYFDIFLYPATNEFTVDAWSPNVFVWGYLAARK